jgi:hypothetical protein
MMPQLILTFTEKISSPEKNYTKKQIILTKRTASWINKNISQDSEFQCFAMKISLAAELLL